MRSRGFSDKHKKALDLLQKGELSISEVAKQSGLSRDHLYDLISGYEKAGPVAQEFSALYSSVVESIDKRINLKQKELKEVVANTLAKWTEEAKDKNLDQFSRKSFIDIAKVLQTGPVYNIGSVSYSRGMTPEELLNEFKRLRASAESALVGERVPVSSRKGEGVLPSPSRRRDKDEKGEKSRPLSAESETGEVSL